MRQNHMSAVADVKAVSQLNPLFREGFGFFQERGGMNHHAVADHAMNLWPEDAGRQERELVSDAVGDDCMPGVRAPLIANDDIMPVAEKVDNLSLGFIAPLQTNHASRRHVGSSPGRKRLGGPALE